MLSCLVALLLVTVAKTSSPTLSSYPRAILKGRNLFCPKAERGPPRRFVTIRGGHHNLLDFTISFWLKAPSGCPPRDRSAPAESEPEHWFDGCGLVTASAPALGAMPPEGSARARRLAAPRSDYGIALDRAGGLMFGVGARASHQLSGGYHTVRISREEANVTDGEW